MKKLLLPLLLSVCFPIISYAQLTQTFEDGEDTDNWGSSGFTDGQVVATFLDSSFGGENAGAGTSAGQSFSRSFQDNTAGVDLSEAYSISLYVQLDTFDGPEGGEFQIVGGSFGSNNAGNLRVTTTGTPGVFAWQARDNNDGWLDLGIALDLENPYHVVITIDPASFTYSASVQRTNALGVGQGAAGMLSNLAFDQNVITNNANGNLLFYVQAEAGGTQALVDNINISVVPEASTVVLAGFAFLVLLFSRRRLLIQL